MAFRSGRDVALERVGRNRAGVYVPTSDSSSRISSGNRDAKTSDKVEPDGKIDDDEEAGKDGNADKAGGAGNVIIEKGDER